MTNTQELAPLNETTELLSCNAMAGKVPSPQHTSFTNQIERLLCGSFHQAPLLKLGELYHLPMFRNSSIAWRGKGTIPRKNNRKAWT